MELDHTTREGVAAPVLSNERNAPLQVPASRLFGLQTRWTTV